MHNIKDLKIRNNSIDLAIKVYDVTLRFLSDERYGLLAQTHRCSVSISSNISEGAGKTLIENFCSS